MEVNSSEEHVASISVNRLNLLHPGFLLGLSFDTDDGGDMLL
jgi:hypothetical protein